MTNTTRALIQAQRRVAGAWRSCDAEPHRAERWAVVTLQKRSSRTVCSFKTRAEAQAVADNINHRNRKRPPPSEPGERYGPTGHRGRGTVIARSLYEHERNQ